MMQLTRDERLESSPVAPTLASCAALRPSDLWGALHFGFTATITACGVVLATFPRTSIWLIGQLLLCVAFLSWFAVLHEAGHKNLFRTPWLNHASGQVAGVLALIPFHCWKFVHARHHRWTGWHDLDPTTSQTLPRNVHRIESIAINLCWWLWIPVFSIIYRVQNYWNLVRLWKQFPRRRQRWQIVFSVAICVSVYLLTLVGLGPARLILLFGCGLYVSFMLQDLLILSQHSHIEMPRSEGRDVRPFPPIEQENFTRSLICPTWFSRLVLLNIDAHELHHMYPRVPGYWLQEFHYRSKNGIAWWRWIWRAKRIRGDVLLFQNRNQTGYDI